MHVRTIILTKGYEAIVDESDYGWLTKYSWCAFESHSGVRAVRGTKLQTIYMSREVIGATQGQLVDHINLNTLDNTRTNLRITTTSQSMMNRRGWAVGSEYKGVTKWKGLWRARIDKNHKQFFLGYFNTPEEAALVYDGAAIQLHGEFARLNFSSVE